MMLTLQRGGDSVLTSAMYASKTEEKPEASMVLVPVYPIQGPQPIDRCLYWHYFVAICG